MPFRGKSIRRKIVALLLVPLVSLTALWAFATVITGREAARLFSAGEVVRKICRPVDSTIQALREERRQTLVYLAAPRSGPAAGLRSAQRATDRTVARFRSGVDGDLREDMSAGTADRLHTVEAAMDGLPALRRKIGERTVDRYGAYRAYNELIDPYYELLGSLGGVQDADLAKQGRALLGLGRAHEAVSREDALLAAAFTAGTMNARELRGFADRVADRRILYNTNLSALPVADQKLYEDYWRGGNAHALTTAEEAVITAGAGRPAVHAVAQRRWQATVGSVLDDLSRMDSDAAARYRDRLEPVADAVMVKAAVAGLLGLIALACSLVVSWRIGRALVQELHRLRREAHEVSGVRLPGLLRRLAAGERVDVETEAPLLDYPPNELGQVGRALNTLQRAAVEAAVKQAGTRRKVSEVFVNFAHRNQVLLHRQLALLEEMERRTEDSAELADLQRLDHLATRMRRYAESLVILSGTTGSRKWCRPVPLMEVVRSAAAEVEDCGRIELRRLPELAVPGAAVLDLTHLLAELLENATVFSPPHTAVQVVGSRVANGFTMEIHDRGPGLPPDALIEANLALAEAPEFELSRTDRLGLFVVSRLARSHGIRVSLQPSPYGGTTAVVLLPSALLTDIPAGAEPEPEAGAVASGRPARRAPVELEPPLSPFEPGPRHLAIPHLSGEPLPGLSGLSGLPGSPGERSSGEHSPGERLSGPRPAAERPRPRTGEATGPPRRRTPVLVSDHGRTLTDALPEAEPTPPGGLPRRPRRPQPPRPPEAEPPPRDAEEVRARMTALQRGWRRGREHGRGTPPSPRTTAPGTTTERDGR
ncbi:sensor histidine kinase [Streptomyces orinoci]|uniref:histidine kinase n=1 Tax=Streptomyces orinoci TaxID=67339 RepID=A0ABV3K606_STRON|nr:nitrate- and nitrite sensing domain-containing protein [Streptomyces orinoci]